MRKLGIAIALLFTVGYLWAQTSVPTGIFALGTNPAGYCPTQTAPTGPNASAEGYVCIDLGGVAFAPTGQKFQYIQASLPAMSFSQISGQLAASQLPATTTCSASLSNVTLDGKGGGSATIVSSVCK